SVIGGLVRRIDFERLAVILLGPLQISLLFRGQSQIVVVVGIVGSVGYRALEVVPSEGVIPFSVVGGAGLIVHESGRGVASAGRSEDDRDKREVWLRKDANRDHLHDGLPP